MFKRSKVETVPTASVVAILKTPEVSKEFFSTNSVAKTLRIAKEQDLVLFDNSNNEILSFSHEVLSSAEKGQAKNIKINIELVDPLFKFEDHFISIGYKSLYGSNRKVLEEINRLRKLKQPGDSQEVLDLRKAILDTSNEINNNTKKLEETQRTFAKYKRQYNIVYLTFGHYETQIAEYEKRITEYTNTKKVFSDKLKILLEEEENQFLTLIRNSISDLERSISPTIYFFYGMGSDQEAWAGPVEGTLFNIEYRYSGDGDVRTLHLEYVASDTIWSRAQEKVFYTGLGRNISVSTKTVHREKIGKEPDLEDYVLKAQKNQYPGKPISDFYNGTDQPKGAAFDDTLIPIHTVVKESLTSFLSEATDLPKYNVLVFFPNLDTYLHSKELVIGSSTYQSLADRNDPSVDVPKITWSNFWKPSNYGLLFKPSSYRDYTDFKIAPTILARQKLYEEIGFIAGIDRYINSDFSTDPIVLPDIVGTGNILETIEREDFVGYGDFVVTLVKKENEVISDVLNRIKGGLINNSSDTFGFIELFYENDPLVRRAYEAYLQKIGINPLETLEYDPEAPLLLFGDTKFILDYFYGLLSYDYITEGNNVKRIGTIDRPMLADKERLEAMANLLRLTSRKNGPYDTVFYSLPDEYAYVPKNENNEIDSSKSTIDTLKSAVAKEKVPVFLHGFENSNVLDIYLDWDLQYFNALNEGFKPSFNDTIAPNSLQSKKMDNAFEQLRKLGAGSLSQENLNSLFEGIKSVLSNSSGSRKDIRNLSYLFQDYFPSLDKNYLEGLSEQLIISVASARKNNLTYDEYVANALPLKAIEMLKRVSQFSMRANIKTLPFFRFYNMSHSLWFKVFFFIHEAAILGQERRGQKISSMLSGEWSIIGFKHVIKENEMYSEFLILRIPGSSHSIHSTIKKEQE